MTEHVILFAGPMGAGKTTAIRSLSEIDVVSTEAENTDFSVSDKAMTTVALDYGEIMIDDAEKVRLYGIPGQRRFDFMWSILRERAVGMVLLVNADASDPVASAVEYLYEFRELYERGGVVIGLTHCDGLRPRQVEAYADAIADADPDILVPVLVVDPRSKADMITTLMTLIGSLEARSHFAEGRVASA